jgi:hypothetical protein
MRKLQQFYHELANALLNVADILKGVEDGVSFNKAFSVSLGTLHEMAGQILNAIGLLEQTRLYILRIWPEAPLPDWFQTSGTAYQIAADVKNVTAALSQLGVWSDTDNLLKLRYSASQLAAKLLALVSARSIDQMQSLVDQYERLIEVERGFAVSFDVEVQRLVSLQERTAATRERVLAAARATEECLKSCSAGEVLRNPNLEDDPEWLKQLKTSYEGLRYSISRESFYKYTETVTHFLPALRYYRDRTKFLTRQVLTAHAGFSVSLIDPQDPAAPEKCRQLASPADPDVMQGLMPPKGEFPDLVVLPARFCSVQEKLDYDRIVLKPVVEKAGKLYREYSHYDSELGIRLQKVNNSRALLHMEDPSQALQLARLDRQREDLEQLRNEFEPAWKKARDTQPKFTALDKAYVDLPVLECGPPTPINIFMPELPEPFCSEKERDEFIAKVSTVLAEVKKHSAARRAYMSELQSRRSVTPDQTLKASLTKEINEAMVVDSAGDQMLSALNDLLDKAKLIEIGACVDPCLVGQWVATRTGTFSPSSKGGGTGFRVTIEPGGRQTVDYAGMEPFEAGQDRIFFAGRAVGRITTKDKVAKVESVDEGNATLQMVIKGTPAPVIWPLPNWFGPGGLGSTTDNNAYTCDDDAVTFTGSTHADRHANFPVTLTRVK